jgi:hypothetical protein
VVRFRFDWNEAELTPRHPEHVLRVQHSMRPMHLAHFLNLVKTHVARLGGRVTLARAQEGDYDKGVLEISAESLPAWNATEFAAALDAMLEQATCDGDEQLMIEQRQTEQFLEKLKVYDKEQRRAPRERRMSEFKRQSEH